MNKRSIMKSMVNEKLIWTRMDQKGLLKGRSNAVDNSLAYYSTTYDANRIINERLTELASEVDSIHLDHSGAYFENNASAIMMIRKYLLRDHVQREMRNEEAYALFIKRGGQSLTEITVGIIKNYVTKAIYELEKDMRDIKIPFWLLDKPYPCHL